MNKYVTYVIERVLKSKNTFQTKHVLIIKNCSDQILFFFFQCELN